jgi:putative membrane protein
VETYDAEQIMFVQKSFGLTSMAKFTGHHVVWLTAWAGLVAVLYEYTQWEWITIPWLPLSVIGTAVAFYLGFKNNSAYDRLWEARKIWGAIVNSSRSWGAAVRGFVSNQFTAQDRSEEGLRSVQRELIYRHISWLYALRSQLLIPTEWEHLRQGSHIGAVTRKRMKEWGVGLFADDVTEREMRQLLPTDECDKVIQYQNTATQLIDRQAQDLKALRAQNLIDDFRHMELQKILGEFYVFQGQCERIKKFPLPRQYANTSFIFVAIFIFLLPLGLVGEFAQLGHNGVWLSIPFTVLVGWVYVMMELVGDYSENPFEGLGNDVPMLAICRTIEIDLREMLGERDLPPAIEPKNGVLM